MTVKKCDVVILTSFYDSRLKCLGKKYTAVQLAEALNSIKSGTMTVYKASKIYNMYTQNLQNKIKNKYTKQPCAGAPTILTSAEETLIVKWLQHLAFHLQSIS